MSVPLTINGVTFNYPQQGDVNWGPTLTNWSTAVTNALRTTSNNFTLLTNHSIIFSDSEGTPKTLTLSIPSPLTATWVLTLPGDDGTAGQVLSTDGLGTTSWINAAGGGTINSGTTGQLAYYPGVGTTLSGETMSGDATIAAGGVLTIANLAITNAKVAAAAAIDVTKLAALTASRAVVTDGSGFITPSTTTATEIGYVNGVTSAIQTQLNTFSVTPVGSITMYAGSAAPSGWLLCDGSVVAQATYPALFAVTSTTFNTGGEGAGNFRLPSLINNAPIGAGSIAALGVQVGSSTHVITTAELPTHNHGVTDPGHSHAITDPSHTHSMHLYTTSGTNGIKPVGQNGVEQGSSPTSAPIIASGTGISINSNTTGITTDNTGSSTAMSLVQPSIGLTFIIKT